MQDVAPTERTTPPGPSAARTAIAMGRATTVFAVLFVAVSSEEFTPQQLQPQQFGTVSSPGQTGPTGFMPMGSSGSGGGGGEELRRTSSEPAVQPETSSVQSRDYSGGSDFYGYNYPASYGPPSSSYGSSGTRVSRQTVKIS